MSDRTCVVDECTRAVFVKSRGECTVHYQRMQRHGSYNLPLKPMKICSAAGCGQELVGSTGRGMCSKHYQRWRKYGQTDLPAGEVQSRHEGRGKSHARCTVDGCDKPHKARGLCSMHDSRERRPNLPAMCGWCWEIFVPRCKPQKFCSDQCAESNRLEYGRQYTARWRIDHPKENAATFPARCTFCHVEFQATRRRYRYCSKVCWLSLRGRGGDPNNARRKQWLRDATVEAFSKLEIFDRDGWICQICHEPIDQEAVFPNPWSASLDHIIPLSKHGEHSRANTRASHLTCNCAKSNKLIVGNLA